MPTNVVKTKKDEKHWSKAKAIAAKSGHSKDWAYIMGIYQKMSGKEHAKKASYEIVCDMLNKMAFVKNANIFDKIKDLADALVYDIRLGLKFPGERIYQQMMRGADKKKIKWLTSELKRLSRGQRKLVEELAKAQAEAITKGTSIPSIPKPPVPPAAT